jgi:hypothetical protein
MEVQGYALKFNKKTQIGNNKWGFIEKIARTALDKADLSDVVFNFNHNMSNLLAGVRNKSLELVVDDVGLNIIARIVDTAFGRDIFTLIKNGLVCRMSWNASILGSEWLNADEKAGRKLDERTITEFGKFLDVSAVTFPAYEDTPISARCLDAEMEQRKKQIYERQISRMNKILGGK